MRFAGTWKQYSKKAISQLTTITLYSGTSRYFKCPYQAKVMKMLEMVSSAIAFMGPFSPFCGLFFRGSEYSQTEANPDGLSQVYVYNFFPATSLRELLLPSQNPIFVAVVGVGVFGRNHARVYKELEQQGELVRLLGVVDPDAGRADAVAREFGCEGFGSVQQMLTLTRPGELQAASVAAPTAQHATIAGDLMKAGVDVLIEKQLAATLSEAEQLVALAAAHKRIAQVGHLERFNPAVRATVPLLTQPMFFEVHRLSVFSPRSLDVDVVLDLMIHDLDIVLAFANSTVKEVRAVGLPILSGKVDIANVRLEFESGCVANLTASRVY